MVVFDSVGHNNNKRCKEDDSLVAEAQGEASLQDLKYKIVKTMQMLSQISRRQ